MTMGFAFETIPLQAENSAEMESLEVPNDEQDFELGRRSSYGRSVQRPIHIRGRPRAHVRTRRSPFYVSSSPANLDNAATVEPGGPISEYTRWVQISLNQVTRTRLPVNGLMDSTTRSAIRSFQEQRGLPPDGVVGPDTERALLDARLGGQENSNNSAEDGASGEQMEFAIGADRSSGCGCGCCRRRRSGSVW